MAEIPRAALDFVTREVGALSDDAKEKVSRLLSSIEWRSDNIAECRALLIDALLSVMPTYTDAAAQAGADFYDAVRASEKGRAIGAFAISGFDSEAFEGAVRAFVQDVVDGEPVERFNSKVIDRVDRDIRRSANMSVAENARLDPLKPKFARVPSGAETCSFCIMLASRGAVYGMAEAASHSHPGCDCRVVPDWGDGIEGYDPAVYYNRYHEMLEGHELTPHLDLMQRNGRNTSRIYQTASYDYEKALGVKKKKNGRSAKYRVEADGLKFDSFEDVKRFLYASTSQEDLERRYSQLGGIWGFDSEQMQSQAMLNAVRHVKKRIGHPFEGGASLGKARIPHNGALSRRDLLSNVQIGLNIENPRVPSGVTRLNVGDYISGLYGEPSPMEFELADGGKCNPYYGEDDAFGRNCPISLAVYEYRRRGFNVSAKGWSEHLTDITDDPSSIWLSSDGKSVWSDGLIGYTEEEAIEFVSSRIGVGQRFGFAFHGHDRFGHVVSIERCEDGDLLVYDAQSGDYYKGKPAEDFISGTADIGGLFRIDDARLAPGIAEEWMDLGFDETVHG